MRKNKHSQAGFTLIEIVVVIAILGTVVVATHDLWMNAIRALGQGEQEVRLQDQVSNAEDEITNHLRYAKEINIRTSLPENFSEEIKEYSYICRRPETGAVVIYHQNEGGEVAGAREVLAGRVDNPNGGIYDYQLNFRRSAEQNQVISFDLNVDNYSLTAGSEIYASNLEDPIGGDESGRIVEFIPIENGLNSLYEELDWNLFWRKFVLGAYSDTLKTGLGSHSWEENADGQELAVSIAKKGDENNTKGGMIFIKMKDKYFEETKASLDSFSLVIDAELSAKESWGYGVLLRGGYDLEDNVDYGYMFQFDPRAHGFVLRRIYGNGHLVAGREGHSHIGGEVVDDNFPNCEIDARGFYTPAEIKSDTFWADKEFNTTNEEEEAFHQRDFWHQRYKTILKVQTQPNGNLIIRAQVMDGEGNKSNQVWFGDFGKIELNGTEVIGGNCTKVGQLPGDYNGNGVKDPKYKEFDEDTGLNWEFFRQDMTGDRAWMKDESGSKVETGYQGKLPGDYIGIRSWTGDKEGDDYKVKFYEMEIKGAEPAVKEVNIVDNRIVLTFDETLSLPSGRVKGKYISPQAFKINNKRIKVTAIKAKRIKVNDKLTTADPMKLILTCNQSLTDKKGNITAETLNYKVPEKKSKALTDGQGNKVHNFEIDLQEKALVNYK